MKKSTTLTVRPMSQPILIVEDNVANMRLFTDVLTSCDYPVYQAVDAETALEILATSPLPRVIIMDIQLPGMSGEECTKIIKADPRLRDIRIIAVTAFAMDGDEKRFRLSGCDDYIAKPVAISAFVHMVCNHYDRVAAPA